MVEVQNNQSFVLTSYLSVDADAIGAVRAIVAHSDLSPYKEVNKGFVIQRDFWIDLLDRSF